MNEKRVPMQMPGWAAAVAEISAQTDSGRTVLVYRPGHPAANENGMVPKSLAGRRLGHPRIHIISDGMAAAWHPCDGKHYDSKSQFRAVTKAHGGVEVGNEKLTPRRPEPDRTIKTDIARAIAELGG